MGQLMRGVKEIRVLKDAILAFQPKSKGCGWHVDDASFWPCPLETPGHEGVNVWIALSDYKKSHGGGLAIAPTSHRADWMKAARDVIRTPLKPGQHANTCGLEMASPEYHNKCEQLRTTLDMAPGDAIIHSRWY
jgi:ectoine hydroxylase-related dioxygenase (phytanoyl-CoA dioxygenase family)